LALDLCRAHDPDKMTAWVTQQDAGIEFVKAPENVLRMPPVQGQVPVDFRFADLPHNLRVTVDSHSASPAFAMEARSLAFDLLKVGAMDAEQLVEHIDAPNPEELVTGIEKRAQERAQFLAQHPEEAAKIAKKGR
jgi:hypothetical protein